MNYALIFAGGTGVRMNSQAKPKQFLELHGKPIIIYTMEHFENHGEIDGIVVVCLADWVEQLERQIQRYEFQKVIKVVVGGKTGHESIYQGLLELKKVAQDQDVVLIHDGVRPLITRELISDNIKMAKEKGAAITVESSWESIIHCPDKETISDVPVREEMFIARAPQSFQFQLIWDLHEKAKEEDLCTTDSTHLCRHYQQEMHIVHSSPNNIKITEPNDFFIFRALYEAFENQQILTG